MFPYSEIEKLFKGYKVQELTDTIQDKAVSIEIVSDEKVMNTESGAMYQRFTAFYALQKHKLKSSDKYETELDKIIDGTLKQLALVIEDGWNIDLTLYPAFIDDKKEIHIFYDIKGFYFI